MLWLSWSWKDSRSDNLCSLYKQVSRRLSLEIIHKYMYIPSTQKKIILTTNLDICVSKFVARIYYYYLRHSSARICEHAR